MIKGRNRIATFPILQILNGKISHRRLKVFRYKGVKCVSCGIKGKFVALEKTISGDIHLDLYAIDNNNQEILMTVDHIIPLSKKGCKYNLNNLQPMCEYCNSKKSDKILEKEMKCL